MYTSPCLLRTRSIASVPIHVRPTRNSAARLMRDPHLTACPETTGRVEATGRLEVARRARPDLDARAERFSWARGSQTTTAVALKLPSDFGSPTSVTLSPGRSPDRVIEPFAVSIADERARRTTCLAPSLFRVIVNAAFPARTTVPMPPVPPQGSSAAQAAPAQPT